MPVTDISGSVLFALARKNFFFFVVFLISVTELEVLHGRSVEKREKCRQKKPVSALDQSTSLSLRRHDRTSLWATLLIFYPSEPVLVHT